MDENLARIERIYPNSKYVLISPYNKEMWTSREYDSSFDNKAPLNKWKSNPLSYDDAQNAVSEGNRIGWVVPDGYVVVDVDNIDDSRSQYCLEKLLEKFEVSYNYNYSSKGMHLLFKDFSNAIKSDSRTKCALNIEIDTRANSTGYIILPCNDPHREWGHWGDFVEDIPYFLLPLFKDATPTFIGMKDGDGRNDVLWRWRFKLERVNKLTKEQIEKSVRIINENLFETPMANQELYKTVLRDKDNQKQSTENKENPFNKIADTIVDKYDIKSYNYLFYMYNGTYYKEINETDLERIIHFEINQNIGKAGRTEIIQFIKVKSQVDVTDFNADWHKIAVTNGVLNLVTGELEQPNKNEVNTIFIPFEYSNDPPYSPRIDEFMKDLCGGDPIKMQFLYQIAGYCLLKKNLFEKFVICRGEGGTGKSTYTNLLHRLVGGDKNTSHVGLADFDKDYYLASTVGKLLNIDDDVVDGKVLQMTGRFKSIVSGNIISVRQIYREVMDFKPYITCIFSCNRLPKIMDKTSGLYRRLILVELNHKIEKPDPLFMNKVTNQDMTYFLYKAVEGIKMAIEEGKFRINQSEEKLLERFKRRQNPLNEWLYDTDIRLGDLHNKRCMIFYKQFTEWALENGYNKILSSYSFKEDICALYDLEIDNVKLETTSTPCQVFIKRGVIDENFKPF